MHQFSQDFPLLHNNPWLVYLDSASTTHKPSFVIDKVQQYVTHDYANIHRGLYDLAQKSEDMYLLSKKKVAWLLGCAPSDIAYGYNATHCSNIIAQSLCYSWFVTSWDIVMLWLWDHHANIVVWQQLQKVFWFEIVYIGVQQDYSIDWELFGKQYTDRVKVVACSHVSNVTGTIYDVVWLSAKLRDDTFFIVDASQSVPHFSVDVNVIGCDALYFTAHKMFAYPGLGVLYLDKKYLWMLQPMQWGGGIVEDVTVSGNTLVATIDKFEAWTPNLVGAVSLLAALEYIDRIGWYATILQHEKNLIDRALQWFKDLWDRVQLLGSYDNTDRVGVFSFSMSSHHMDVSEALAAQKICIRSGGHCAHPFLHTLWTKGLVRASIALYNTQDDLDIFFKTLTQIS